MIEIQNWRDGPKDGKYLFMFDVYLPKAQLTLRNFKVLKRKDGSGFITAPTFKKEFVEGKEAWVPYFSFNGDRNKEFFEKLNELLKDQLCRPTNSSGEDFTSLL